MKPFKLNRPVPIPMIIIPLVILSSVIYAFNYEPTAIPDDRIAKTDSAETNALSALSQSVEVDPLDEFRPKLQELNQQQIALKDQLSKHNAALEQIKLQVTDLQHGFSETTKQIQVQSRWRLEQNKRKKPRIVKRRKPRQTRPQWILASIDQWGASQTAVLQDGLQLITMRQGEQYRGWQLTAIHANEHQVELVNARQQPLTLRLH